MCNVRNIQILSINQNCAIKKTTLLNSGVIFLLSEVALHQLKLPLHGIGLIALASQVLVEASIVLDIDGLVLELLFTQRNSLVVLCLPIELRFFLCATSRLNVLPPIV